MQRVRGSSPLSSTRITAGQGLFSVTTERGLDCLTPSLVTTWIAVTAQYEGCALITHDKGMRRRAEAAGISNYSTRELISKSADEAS
jgi:hypothetical protein